MSFDTTDVFQSYQLYLNKEQDLREEIRNVTKDIEQTCREILTNLQSIHKSDGIKKIPTICADARHHFAIAKAGYSKLAELIPVDQYYRYHDHWRFVTQRLVFLAALTVYLESGELASREIVAEFIGVKIGADQGFHLDLEDYLMGLLSLSSELSRFAVNSVTSGDYSRPLEISQFVAQMSAGFRLLNLKNDNLRKRFDGLKYDIKKIEEVVYDLSIRGLKPGGSVDESVAVGKEKV